MFYVTISLVEVEIGRYILFNGKRQVPLYMIHVIIGFISSVCLAAFARLLWPATVGRHKKFTSTILLAIATVGSYFWSVKEYGLLYPTYVLGLLVVGICLIILIRLRQHRLNLEEQSLLAVQAEGLLDKEEVEIETPLTEDEAIVSIDSIHPASAYLPEMELSASGGEQGPSYSSDQEAIDAMIQEFYRQSGQELPEAPKEEPMEETVAEAPISLSTISEDEIADIVQSFIQQESPQETEQEVEVNARLDDEELLMNEAWRQAVSLSLEEAAMTEESPHPILHREDTTTEENEAELPMEEDLLVSDLSSLLKEELGESVGSMTVQSVMEPAQPEPKPEPKAEAYLAPVHLNKLANEKPSSTVLKMEELVIPVEMSTSQSQPEEKPAEYLFELEELLDSSAKR